MEEILYIRQKLKKIYAEYGTYFLMLLKFATALCIFFTINAHFGYRSLLMRPMILLAFALFGSLLPWGFITFFSCLLLIGNLSAFSLEAAGMILALIFILAILRYLTLPGCSIVTALLPVLFCWNMPYLIPLFVGMTGGVTGFVSVGSGVIIFYCLRVVEVNAGFLADTANSTLIERMYRLFDAAMKNKEMLLVVVAFSVTTLVVWLLRRLWIDYMEYISIAVGAILIPVILLMGRTSLDLPGSVWGVLFGSLLAVIPALLYQFWCCAVSYADAERLQFEDDDYVYYVKAVPKVALPEKQVKVKSITAAFDEEEKAMIRQAVESETSGAGVPENISEEVD